MECIRSSHRPIAPISTTACIRQAIVEARQCRCWSMLDDPGTVDEEEHVSEANAKTSRPALTKVIDVDDLDYPS